MTPITRSQFVGSPACIPQLSLEEILPLYASLGFHKFEAFSTWCRSALDLTRDPSFYRDIAARHGIAITSFHLPPITDDFDASLAKAIDAACFAQTLGAEVMLYKANSRANYIRGARPFLDALVQHSVRVVPVLQNHKGSPITTPADFREVMEGIGDDRMKTLLEVGHFQRVGVGWREGYDLLEGRIALVHVNEIDDSGASVPFGTGRVDFAGLFKHLAVAGYRGNIVVELELATRDADIPRTVKYLTEVVAYLESLA